MSQEVDPKGSVPIGLIVCGPCACGKSEIASALASHFKAPFVDADTYHSKENIAKMSSGIPLTDKDRFPWLVTVRKEMILQKISQRLGQYVTVVAACSALTKNYRKVLRGVDIPECKVGESAKQVLKVVFVFLNCTESVLQARIDKREGHFMKGNMLQSQLATVEIPHGEVVKGHAVIVNGDNELNDVVKEAIEKLNTLFTKYSV